jgi:hypothetical protein
VDTYQVGPAVNMAGIVVVIIGADVLSTAVGV